MMMTVAEFWRATSDVYNLYHDRFKRAILTDEERAKDVDIFLSDIDGLASEWRSRDTGKVGAGAKYVRLSPVSLYKAPPCYGKHDASALPCVSCAVQAQCQSGEEATER